MEELEKIKQEYNHLEIKYSLPSFNKLAEDFDLEKSLEKQSSFLLREIRRAIGEKLGAYTHLFETFLNPGQTPMFIFNILKNSNGEERELLKKFYKNLARLQLQAIKLDTIYNEEKEAKLIVDSNQVWQEIKPELYSLFENFEQRIDEDNNVKKGGYFG